MSELAKVYCDDEGRSSGDVDFPRVSVNTVLTDLIQCWNLHHKLKVGETVDTHGGVSGEFYPDNPQMFKQSHIGHKIVGVEF